VSFMIFTASVRNILKSTTYKLIPSLNNINNIIFLIENDPAICETEIQALYVRVHN
jgi:hypothetical protein